MPYTYTCTYTYRWCSNETAILHGNMLRVADPTDHENTQDKEAVYRGEKKNPGSRVLQGGLLIITQ